MADEKKKDAEEEEEEELEEYLQFTLIDFQSLLGVLSCSVYFLIDLLFLSCR